jgi:hypothetical protein
VEQASRKIRRRYSSYLPKVLLDFYLAQFSRGAHALLDHLQSLGYDFAYAEVPDRKYLPEMKLVEDAEGSLYMYGIPDLLFYGGKRLIGEMKWGAAVTADTANTMFKMGEFQFCFYPELERQHRQLLESADFRYFRLNVFAELGSPAALEQRLRTLGAPAKIDRTLRIFGLAPTPGEVRENLENLRNVGRGILRAEFRILEDPSDLFSPCTDCRFMLICRRTHSSTLLRAKRETGHEEDSDLL